MLHLAGSGSFDAKAVLLSETRITPAEIIDPRTMRRKKFEPDARCRM
jgi:hypothetical protein